MAFTFNASAYEFTPSIFGQNDFPALSGSIMCSEDFYNPLAEGHAELQHHLRECMMAVNTVPQELTPSCMMVVDAANVGFISLNKCVEIASQGYTMEKGSLIFGSKPEGLLLPDLSLPEFFQEKEPKQAEKKINTDSLGHLAINEIILNEFENPVPDGTPKVLKLLTGDGNSHPDGITDFTKCVRRAVRFGWKVQIWSFHSRCAKVYQDMAANGEIELFYFDDYGIKRGSCAYAHCSDSYPGAHYKGENNITIPKPLPENSQGKGKGKGKGKGCHRCGGNHFVRDCPKPRSGKY